MKAQNNPKKNGGVLLMAMLVMLIFTTMAIGLFKLLDSDAVETVHVEHHRRALWMAEAGQEKVWDRLRNDVPFRDNPNLYLPYTVAYNQGSFSNASYKIETITSSSPGNTGSVYTITTVGYAGNMNRRIQQNTLVGPGGPNALRAKGGDVVIDSNVHIDGDVFVDSGDVTIQAKENLNSQYPTGIDGNLVVSAGNVDGRGAASVDIIEAPAQPQPSIDMTYWQPFLDGVTNNANTNGLAGVSAVHITTAVSNYNYSATMQTDKGLTISGTASGLSGLHYLVSATSILFNNDTELMKQTAVVVDGDVTFDQKLTFHDNCIVFADGDIYVRQSSDAGGTGATLIATGDIKFEQNMVFHGIVYAEVTVDVGSNAEVTGTIIAGNGINIDSNAKITFDPDVFLNPLPGLNNVHTDVHLVPLNWTEIAPE